MSEIKLHDQFKNTDPNYKKPLTILEILPNNVFKVSYDTDFEENSFYDTEEGLLSSKYIRITN